MKTIEREVIVVGSGPGGSACASYMAREGVDVLLLDKERWPRDKVCGDSQAEVTMKHVRELGAFEELSVVGYPNKGFLLTSPDYQKAYLPAPGVRFSTPRRLFDNIMKNTAIRHGAEFMEECWVSDVIMEDGQVRGVKAKYEGEYVEFRSKIVIGADGAHSRVARALGMFPDNPPDTGAGLRCFYENCEHEGYIEIHFDKDVLPGYIWIFPSGSAGNNVVNVGIGFGMDIYNGRTLQESVEVFIQNSPFGERLKKAKQISPWKGWRLPTAPQAFDNFAAGAMLIGDAGSFILPLTGEGVGPAMETGKMAADTAMEALKKGDFSLKTMSKFGERWHNTYDEKYKSMLAMNDAFRKPEAINDTVNMYLTNEEFKAEVLKLMYFADSAQ